MHQDISPICEKVKSLITYHRLTGNPESNFCIRTRGGTTSDTDNEQAAHSGGAFRWELLERLDASQEALQHSIQLTEMIFWLLWIQSLFRCQIGKSIKLWEKTFSPKRCSVWYRWLQNPTAVKILQSQITFSSEFFNDRPYAYSRPPKKVSWICCTVVTCRSADTSRRRLSGVLKKTSKFSRSMEFWWAS